MSFFLGKNKSASKEDIEKFELEENIDNLLWVDYGNKLFKLKTKVGLKPSF